MKLSHVIFDTPIVFEENKINVLVLEDKDTATELIMELSDKISGNDSGFILSDSINEEIPFSKVELISDLFNLDLNNRKIINKITGILTQEAMNEEHFYETSKIQSELEAYMESIIADIDYDLQLAEISVSDVFKTCNIYIDNYSRDISDMLLSYMKVLSNIIGIKLFIILNLKLYLSDDKLKELYKSICYNKYNVLLIEAISDSVRYDCEKYKIIDKDLCEIS